MLENLLQHSNLGTSSQIIYLIDLLMKGNYSIADLKQMCVSKEYSFSSSFDGIISLLKWLKIIKICDNVVLNQKINVASFTTDICNTLFANLSKENQLHNFLNNNNLYFEKNIYIKNSLVKLSYSPIRNFLIELNIFEKDDLIYNQFIVNEKFTKWFIDYVVPLIDDSQIKNNSLDSLKNQQKLQDKLGAEAEKFVLNYEISIRKNHSKYTNIKIISVIDTRAGYDIQSYQDDNSFLINKFIEVKSYSGSPYFYWSKNEIKVAKQKQDNYFLYLVDRNKMDNKNYQPLIVQNPYKDILNNKNWQKDCQTWKFENITQ